MTGLVKQSDMHKYYGAHAHMVWWAVTIPNRITVRHCVGKTQQPCDKLPISRRT